MKTAPITADALPALTLPAADTRIDPAAAAPLYRAALASAAGELAALFQRGTPAGPLLAQRAALVDRVLTDAWSRYGFGDDSGTALIAVGGYGRGELHPASDVDILILLARQPDARLRERIERFVALLWDIGLEPGHGVRTLQECESAARADVTTATNLMEARLLAGQPALLAAMRERTAAPRVWPAAAFFAAKLSEQCARHLRFNDSAYNLEPNVKEGPGGLRDIQMVGWVAKRHFGDGTLAELVAPGFLTESEHRALAAGQAFLWDVRFALHLLAGRREERLLFDHQAALAAHFGHRDDGRHLGIERFMKRYYRTVQELSRLNEMLLGFFQEEILDREQARRITPINRRFRAVNGYLDTVDPGVFRRNRFALLELFLVLQQHPELKGVRASTIRQVRTYRHFITDAFRRDIRARGLFLEILRQPHGITHELRRMHRYGVLGAYLPEFGKVIGQMQYDLFHTYTVDEHSLFVVRNMRRLAVAKYRHEFPLCSDLLERLPKPELLYIAGLFHDLAKGRGGDHSEIGAQLALDFCSDHGLGRYDARLVAWLVRHHLVMSTTAQRRDIHDPEVVAEFAALIGDRVHLDYLYLLTIADIRATNPSLWNDWKDRLFTDLYESTARALRRGLDNPVDRAELIAETQHEALALLTDHGDSPDAVQALWASLGSDYFLRQGPADVAWHTHAILAHADPRQPLILVRPHRGGTAIFVYARDQKFLFAATTAILGRHRLNILDARIITASNAMTLDSYIVLDRAGTALSERRQHEVRVRLERELLDPATVRRAAGHSASRRLRHFARPTRLEFNHDPRKAQTILEVAASDRPGLLAAIGWTLADARVRLHAAKAATFGERVEDTFIITDSHNHPLDPKHTELLHAALLETLDGSRPVPHQPPVTGGKNATSSPSRTG